MVPNRLRKVLSWSVSHKIWKSGKPETMLMNWDDNITSSSVSVTHLLTHTDIRLFWNKCLSSPGVHRELDIKPLATGSDGRNPVRVPTVIDHGDHTGMTNNFLCLSRYSQPFLVTELGGFGKRTYGAWRGTKSLGGPCPEPHRFPTVRSRSGSLSRLTSHRDDKPTMYKTDSEEYHR